MQVCRRLGSAAIIVLCAAAVSQAAVYRVGPGEKYALVSQVADGLKPGDVVEVTGDVTDSFTLSRHGRYNQPITIRGVTRIQKDRIIRPRITLDYEKGFGIRCKGDWNVLEGLDIGRGIGPRVSSGTSIYHQCDHLVIRNCRIHHQFQGLWSDQRNAGDALVEFCEFNSNGSAGRYHSLDFGSCKPGATVTVQFCYFHDATGGTHLKSHSARNVIRYNWFEDSYYNALSIMDMLSNIVGEKEVLQSAAYPMHTDIVGNVFLQGWSPGSRYAVLKLGGEHETAPGTEGDFTIAHNLFITTRRTPGVVPDDETVHLRVEGNVDHVRLYNNIFLEYGVTGAAVYSRGRTWDTQRTRGFVERRGSSEPIVEGSNNWITEKAIGIPETFVKTIRGTNPKFVDLLNFDFRPRSDSSLAGVGMWPLPKGRMVDLVPEFEAQRGVPADLKPKPRRKVIPPSIGPFEVEK